MDRIKLLLIIFSTSCLVLAQDGDIDTTITTTTTTTTVTLTNTTNAPVYVPKPNTTVCYNHVGCFDNNFPYNNTGFYLPISPEELNTDFQLYTNFIENDTDTLDYLNEESLKNSRFNKNYPLKVVIHGFQNTGRTQWVIDMAYALLKGSKQKANVITVDWGIGAVFPLYNNASSNTRLVGRQTCMLVKLIRKVFYGDTWSKDFNIHCIGHSLGAHTCGYASKECDTVFDRISAMDPAGPFFEGYDDRVRVDPTDAKFVDVIHSNGDNLLTGNFGMSVPCGHVDFYPNGGKQQPGCPSLVGSLIGLLTNASAAISGVSCSHARAIYFFMESINSPCTYLGYPCDSQARFEKGDCLDCTNGGCAFMGYYTSTKSRGTKYLLTDSREPFCGYHYLVEVTIGVLDKKTAGEIIVWFQSDINNGTGAVTKTSDDLNATTTYKRVFISDLDIVDAQKMFITFNKKPKPIIGADPNAPEVYVDKVKISHAELDDEVYSECFPRMRIADKEKKEINLKPSDCTINRDQKKKRSFLSETLLN